jgi:ATP-dependent DNA helicase 2 subunit 2
MSFNPAIHRTKQALFHGAVVEDIDTYPLPPPHPEITRYFEQPRRVLKRAHNATQACVSSFNVKHGIYSQV